MELTVPRYWKSFACIGGVCEGNCCKGDWQITLDKLTFDKYNRLLPDDLDVKFTEENDDNNQFFKAGSMILEDGNCKYLDDEDYCQLQRKYGEEMLCVTCRIFPRTQVINLVDEFFVGLSTACPEVVRTALLAKKDFRFTTIRLKDDHVMLLNNAVIHVNNPFLKDLHNAVLDIMRVRTGATLIEQILVTGLLLEKADELKPNTANLTAKFRAYPNALKAGEYAGLADSFPKNDVLESAMCHKLFYVMQNKFIGDNVFSYAFSNFFEKIKKYTGQESFTSKDAIQYVKELEVKHWKSFADKYEYALANYLCNYIFTKKFPDFEPGIEKYRDMTLFLAVQYQIIKILLLSAADENDGITEQVFTKVMFSYSRAYNHGMSAVNTVTAFIESEMSSLAHVALLLGV
ncbi:hypothetical protein FACS189499_06860 [Clostridia bacterium]|nr:hypothetical protein FACS189499_06860 [Clostridia bacterium]